MENINTQLQAPYEKMSKTRWFYVVLPLLLLFVVSTMDKANINILLANKSFLEDLSINGNLVKGTLSSIFLVTYAIGQFGWGFAIDRIGPLRAGIAGILLWTLAMFLGGISESISGIFWSRAILGIGEGVLYPIALKLTSRWFPANEQAKAQTAWFNGNAIGPVVGLPLIAIITASYGWRESYYVLAGCSLVTLVIFWVMVRDYPSKHFATNTKELDYIENNKKEEAAGASKKSIISVLKNPMFWVLTIIYSCFSIGFFGMTTFLPSYLTETKGIAFVNSAMINSGGFALAVLIQMISGYLSDKLMKRAVFVAVTSAVIILLMVLTMITTSSTSAAILTILLISCLLMPAAITMTMLQRVASSEVMGSIGGVFGCVSYLIAALGPIVVGTFSQVTDSYNGGFIAIIFFFILSLILSFGLMRKGY